MKTFYSFLIIIVLIICSCKSTSKIHKEFVRYNTEYTPIDANEYGWTIPYDSSGFVGKRKLLFASREEKLGFLKNQGTLISIIETTVKGDINFGPAKASTKNSSYRVVMDYAKYKVHRTTSGDAKIGIGLRMVAQVTTTENDINLGDLFAIGLAAQANHLHGTLSLDVIGMDSKEITYLLPFQSEINKTTIQNAMQALATIKTEIYNDSTKVYPHILSVKPKLTGTYNGLGEYNQDVNVKINEVIDILSKKQSKPKED
ncbi:hypothetical protein VBY74_12490 [Tenacibaculum ascidiaceicola]|uniref:hypothetical protein n=1 Tax=Tenacibaculum ascidiaceicola TaxID=1699411 RepID=UPI0039EB8D4B